MDIFKIVDELLENDGMPFENDFTVSAMPYLLIRVRDK